MKLKCIQLAKSAWINKKTLIKNSPPSFLFSYLQRQSYPCNALVTISMFLPDQKRETDWHSCFLWTFNCKWLFCATVSGNFMGETKLKKERVSIFLLLSVGWVLVSQFNSSFSENLIICIQSNSLANSFIIPQKHNFGKRRMMNLG